MAVLQKDEIGQRWRRTPYLGAEVKDKDSVICVVYFPHFPVARKEKVEWRGLEV